MIYEENTTIFGIGGAGKNVIMSLVNRNIENCKFVFVNSDRKSLQEISDSNHFIKIPIGEESSKANEFSVDPEVAKLNIKKEKAKINEILRNTRRCIIVAGLGGTTGTGASIELARLCKEKKVSTLAFVTLPFEFESEERNKVARKYLRELQRVLDDWHIFNNDYITKQFERDISLIDALSKINNEIIKLILNTIKKD